MKAITYILIIASFVFGLFFTITQVGRDNELSQAKTPRVNLLRSYWYEGYAPNKLMRDAPSPIVPLVMDKCALPIYAAHNNVSLVGQADGDTLYVLTAYRRNLTGNLSGRMKCERINPDVGLHNIYRVTWREL